VAQIDSCSFRSTDRPFVPKRRVDPTKSASGVSTALSSPGRYCLFCCREPSPLMSPLWRRPERLPREVADAVGAAHIGGSGVSCAFRLHPAQKLQIRPEKKPRLVSLQSDFACHGSDPAIPPNFTIPRACSNGRRRDRRPLARFFAFRLRSLHERRGRA
jgi:hypothetical protein